MLVDLVVRNDWNRAILVESWEERKLDRALGSRSRDLGLPGGPEVRILLCNAGDMSPILGWRTKPTSCRATKLECITTEPRAMTRESSTLH